MPGKLSKCQKADTKYQIMIRLPKLKIKRMKIKIHSFPRRTKTVLFGFLTRRLKVDLIIWKQLANIFRQEIEIIIKKNMIF